MEELLSKMDNYFVGKKESEKWLVILGVVGVIGYLAYTTLLPITQEKFNQTKVKKEMLKKAIAQNENYLRSISRGDNQDYMLNQYKKEKADKSTQLVKIKKDIRKIDKKLTNLSDMLFNEKSWSKFLNTLTQRAESNGLHVRYLNNKYIESKGNFGHILEVSIGVEGSYKGTINFLNDIEQDKLVTDVYGLHLGLDEKSSKIIADIDISVWGINH